MKHAFFMLVVLCGVTAGCSSSPSTFDVSGAVTHQGKPVPAGTIQFTPDAAGGDNGIAGFADIKNGGFDTQESGQGIEGGAYIVTINGFDGDADPDHELPLGTPTFSNYTVKLDISKDGSPIAIDVP